MKFSIFLGDIADVRADAVCTSTNPRLSLMMGTGASIRARGGPAILQACQSAAPLPAGAVLVTTAGLLPYKAVIHCVASDETHHSAPAIIASCVTGALAAAYEAGAAVVAMPLFGSGHAHRPFLDVARTMAETALAAKTGVAEIRFVTNDSDRVEPLSDLLRRMTGQRIDVERSASHDDEPVSLWSDDWM